MTDKTEHPILVVVATLAMALSTLGCGNSEPVGGFLTFTPLEDPSCTITNDPTTTTMVVEGIVENIAGDKAVNVDVVANFYLVPNGSQSGAMSICTVSLSLGELRPESQTIETLTCVTQDAECPRSYTVVFPNNNSASYAGSF